MRRKKERSKQGQTNKQGKARPMYTCTCIYMDLLIFLWKSNCLGCAVLPCCLFDLACFFLPSHLSLKRVYLMYGYIAGVLKHMKFHVHIYMYIHVQKAKQHSTPKAVTFPKKNELPRVGFEPTTLYTLDRVLSSVYWAQISHLIVHLMNRLTCTLYISCVFRANARSTWARRERSGSESCSCLTNFCFS